MASPSYKLAYPFPRLISAPQTPQHLPDLDSSPMARPRNQSSVPKGTTLALLSATAFLLWMISPLLRSPIKPDRVPFSKEAVDE